MTNAHDVLFRTLADPTRRAIFERLCREGERTVGALTARAGVSQPAVSKHLGVLKQAGLVRDRHEGRQTHYSAQLGALAPLIDWTSQMAGFWQSRFDDLEAAPEKDGPINQTSTEAISSQDPALLRRLLRAKDRMDAASHEEWPVPRLARVSGVSEAHFARKFKEAFGIPPHRYLLTRRIERAKALLRDTELSITEIAFQTGWESLGTFGRTFRDITGESPSALRAREKIASHELERVPHCFISAAHRPDLRIAVSEKRRHDAGGIDGSEETEVVS
jgi:AraC-like DNA-binding protein